MEPLELEFCSSLGEWVFADCILVRRVHGRSQGRQAIEGKPGQHLKKNKEMYDVVGVTTNAGEATNSGNGCSQMTPLNRISDIPTEISCAAFSSADGVPFAERVRQFAMINLSSDPNVIDDPKALTAAAGLPLAMPSTGAFRDALCISKPNQGENNGSQVALPLESNCCPMNLLPDDVDAVHISCWALSGLVAESNHYEPAVGSDERISTVHGAIQAPGGPSAPHNGEKTKTLGRMCRKRFTQASSNKLQSWLL